MIAELAERFWAKLIYKVGKEPAIAGVVSIRQEEAGSYARLQFIRQGQVEEEEVKMFGPDELGLGDRVLLDAGGRISYTARIDRV